MPNLLEVSAARQRRADEIARERKEIADLEKYIEALRAQKTAPPQGSSCSSSEYHDCPESVDRDVGVQQAPMRADSIPNSIHSTRSDIRSDMPSDSIQLNEPIDFNDPGFKNMVRKSSPLFYEGSDPTGTMAMYDDDDDQIEERAVDSAYKDQIPTLSSGEFEDSVERIEETDFVHDLLQLHDHMQVRKSLALSTTLGSAASKDVYEQVDDTYNVFCSPKGSSPKTGSIPVTNLWPKPRPTTDSERQPNIGPDHPAGGKHALSISQTNALNTSQSLAFDAPQNSHNSRQKSPFKSSSPSASRSRSPGRLGAAERTAGSADWPGVPPFSPSSRKNQRGFAERVSEERATSPEVNPYSGSNRNSYSQNISHLPVHSISLAEQAWERRREITKQEFRNSRSPLKLVSPKARNSDTIVKSPQQPKRRSQTRPSNNSSVREGSLKKSSVREGNSRRAAEDKLETLVVNRDNRERSPTPVRVRNSSMRNTSPKNLETLRVKGDVRREPQLQTLDPRTSSVIIFEGGTDYKADLASRIRPELRGTVLGGTENELQDIAIAGNTKRTEAPILSLSDSEDDDWNDGFDSRTGKSRSRSVSPSPSPTDARMDQSQSPPKQAVKKTTRISLDISTQQPSGPMIDIQSIVKGSQGIPGMHGMPGMAMQGMPGKGVGVNNMGMSGSNVPQKSIDGQWTMDAGSPMMAQSLSAQAQSAQPPNNTLLGNETLLDGPMQRSSKRTVLKDGSPAAILDPMGNRRDEIRKDEFELQGNVQNYVRKDQAIAFSIPTGNPDKITQPPILSPKSIKVSSTRNSPARQDSPGRAGLQSPGKNLSSGRSATSIGSPGRSPSPGRHSPFKTSPRAKNSTGSIRSSPRGKISPRTKTSPNTLNANKPRWNHSPKFPKDGHRLVDGQRVVVSYDESPYRLVSPKFKERMISIESSARRPSPANSSKSSSRSPLTQNFVVGGAAEERPATSKNSSQDLGNADKKTEAKGTATTGEHAHPETATIAGDAKPAISDVAEAAGQSPTVAQTVSKGTTTGEGVISHHAGFSHISHSNINVFTYGNEGGPRNSQGKILLRSQTDDADVQYHEATMVSDGAQKVTIDINLHHDEFGNVSVEPVQRAQNQGSSKFQSPSARSGQSARSGKSGSPDRIDEPSPSPPMITANRFASWMDDAPSLKKAMPVTKVSDMGEDQYLSEATRRIESNRISQESDKNTLLDRNTTLLQKLPPKPVVRASAAEATAPDAEVSEDGIASRISAPADQSGSGEESSASPAKNGSQKPGPDVAMNSLQEARQRKYLQNCKTRSMQNVERDLDMLSAQNGQKNAGLSMPNFSASTGQLPGMFNSGVGVSRQPGMVNQPGVLGQPRLTQSAVVGQPLISTQSAMMGNQPPITAQVPVLLRNQPAQSMIEYGQSPTRATAPPSRNALSSADSVATSTNGNKRSSQLIQPGIDQGEIPSPARFKASLTDRSLAFTDANLALDGTVDLSKLQPSLQWRVASQDQFNPNGTLNQVGSPQMAPTANQLAFSSGNFQDVNIMRSGNIPEGVWKSNDSGQPSQRRDSAEMFRPKQFSLESDSVASMYKNQPAQGASGEDSSGRQDTSVNRNDSGPSRDSANINEGTSSLTNKEGRGRSRSYLLPTASSMNKNSPQRVLRSIDSRSPSRAKSPITEVLGNRAKTAFGKATGIQSSDSKRNFRYYAEPYSVIHGKQIELEEGLDDLVERVSPVKEVATADPAQNYMKNYPMSINPSPRDDAYPVSVQENTVSVSLSPIPVNEVGYRTHGAPPQATDQSLDLAQQQQNVTINVPPGAAKQQAEVLERNDGYDSGSASSTMAVQRKPESDDDIYRRLLAQRRKSENQTGGNQTSGQNNNATGNIGNNDAEKPQRNSGSNNNPTPGTRGKRSEDNLRNATPAHPPKSASLAATAQQQMNSTPNNASQQMNSSTILAPGSVGSKTRITRNNLQQSPPKSDMRRRNSRSPNKQKHPSRRSPSPVKPLSHMAQLNIPVLEMKEKRSASRTRRSRSVSPIKPYSPLKSLAENANRSLVGNAGQGGNVRVDAAPSGGQSGYNSVPLPVQSRMEVKTSEMPVMNQNAQPNANTTSVATSNTIVISSKLKKPTAQGLDRSMDADIPPELQDTIVYEPHGDGGFPNSPQQPHEYDAKSALNQVIHVSTSQFSGTGASNANVQTPPATSATGEFGLLDQQEQMTPHQKKMAKKIQELRDRKEKEAAERKLRWENAKKQRLSSQHGGKSQQHGSSGVQGRSTTARCAASPGDPGNASKKDGRPPSQTPEERAAATKDVIRIPFPGGSGGGQRRNTPPAIHNPQSAAAAWKEGMRQTSPVAPVRQRSPIPPARQRSPLPPARADPAGANPSRHRSPLPVSRENGQRRPPPLDPRGQRMDSNSQTPSKLLPSQQMENETPTRANEGLKELIRRKRAELNPDLVPGIPPLDESPGVQDKSPNLQNPNLEKFSPQSRIAYPSRSELPESANSTTEYESRIKKPMKLPERAGYASQSGGAYGMGSSGQAGGSYGMGTGSSQSTLSTMNHGENMARPKSSNGPSRAGTISGNGTMCAMEQTIEDPENPGIDLTGLVPNGQKRNYILPKYKEKSNRRLVRNAVLILLQGEASRGLRESILQEIDSIQDERFVIVFRGSHRAPRRDFRALYALRGTQWIRVAHLFGCPSRIDSGMVDKFYRFESGSRFFKEIVGANEISGVVDAVFLKQEHLPRAKQKGLF